MTGDYQSAVPGTRYARLLRLRRIKLTSGAAFVLSEGVLAAGVVLSLAELTPWPVILMLPAVVALGLKLCDAALLVLNRHEQSRHPNAAAECEPSGSEQAGVGTVYRSAVVPSDGGPPDSSASALATEAVAFPVFAAERSHRTRGVSAPSRRSGGINQRQSVWFGGHTETPPQR